jgi:hypothetical protein
MHHISLSLPDAAAAMSLASPDAAVVATEIDATMEWINPPKTHVLTLNPPCTHSPSSQNMAYIQFTSPGAFWDHIDAVANPATERTDALTFQGMY